MYKFEWGPSSWGTYPYVESGYTGNGTTSVHVEKSAATLEPGVSYHFRLSATSEGGTATPGSEKTFTATPLTDYVALGDSYSAGTGTGTEWEDWTSEAAICQRTKQAYPYLLHIAHTAWKFIDKACHGAVTGDVINSQVNALTENTRWVTYTIGGNDAGFKEVLTACWHFGGSGCTNAIQKAKGIIEGTLPTQLDKINHLIKLKAKWAKVIVLDYPRLFKRVEPEDCDIYTFFLEADMKKMNELAELLGKKLHEAALRAGSNFIFKSVASTFDPHALCDAQPWINNYSDSPELETFHPNRLGHELGYYQVVHGVTG